MMRGTDLLCFSHLRWNFVFQRPNHLMKRCSEERRVFFIEEPVHDAVAPFLQVEGLGGSLFRVVPHLITDSEPRGNDAAFAGLLQLLERQYDIREPIHWYYSPIFLDATRELASC